MQNLRRRYAVKSAPLAVIGIVASLLLLPATGAAQSAAEPMSIEFVGDDAQTPGEYLSGQVTVTVGQVICVTEELDPSAERVSVLVGTSEQPEACRSLGAPLSFFGGSPEASPGTFWDHELWEMVAFDPGASVEFTNFAPPPPHSPASGVIPQPRHVEFHFAEPRPAGPGVHLTIWRLGTVEQAAAFVASMWVTVDGEFTGYIVGAPDFVNAGFTQIFPHGFIPAGATLLVLIEEP